MTPVSCCTASSGQWCPCCWERSLCSWRCVRAPWLFELRLSRRGSAPMKCATTSLPRPRVAAATRPKSRSQRTLTPRHHRQQGPCHCLQCQCAAVIENTEMDRRDVFPEIWSWKMKNRPEGRGCPQGPAPSGFVSTWNQGANLSVPLMWAQQTGSVATAGHRNLLLCHSHHRQLSWWLQSCDRVQYGTLKCSSSGFPLSPSSHNC